MHHQANASAHVDEGIESHQNKDNSSMICAWKDSSIETPHQTYFFRDLISQHQLLL
jgi:hypothetical protein